MNKAQSRAGIVIPVGAENAIKMCLVTLAPGSPPDFGRVRRNFDVGPDFGPPGWAISRGQHLRRTGCAVGIHERYRRFVADGAVRSDLAVVSTPFLHFLAGVVKAKEPVLLQALGPELAVERLDVRIVGGFAGPGEV